MERDGWIVQPLSTIEHIFRENETSYQEKIESFFKTQLQTTNIDEKIPSLNDVAFPALSNNSLVQFRCMIQDMFDPEFYFEIYNTKNLQTNEMRKQLGRYRECAESPPGCDIQHDSCDNVTLDRHTLYCVPIPGETAWVKQGLQTMSVYNTPSTSKPFTSHKRPLDDITTDQPITASESEMVVEGSKRLKCEDGRAECEGGSVGVVGQPGFNFPLPDQTGPVCLAKVYTNSDSPVFKLNDVVLFYGVLTFQPSLNHEPASQGDEEMCEFLDPTSGLDLDAHQRMLPSLFPRLHVLHYKHLLHINPTLPRTLTTPSQTEKLLEDLVSVRTDVFNILVEVLYGDSLAAEYLLLHLLSHVYARRNIISLGQLSLSLSHLPDGSRLPTALNTLFQSILEKCYMFEMTLSAMNASLLRPKKDYTHNRLTAGILQLSDRTNLIVNETALQPGQLDNNGVYNVKSLADLISWQKVEYDFGYHTTDFAANIAVLTLSEGRSVLPSDCQVPLKPVCGHTLDSVGVVHTITTAIHDSVLQRMREYLTVGKLVHYELSTSIQQMVQDDFVEMRKQDPHRMTPDDLHKLLTIARLVSLSEGQTCLTDSSWNKAKRLETERRRRVELVRAPRPTNMEE